MSAVRISVKFAYGLGQVGEQIKNQGFSAFLFFYFTQVLGLSGSLAGTAILVALIFDAVTDPVAGSLSDNWRSPRGRRHPFMYASAIPLGLTYFGLYAVPSGLGQWGLFAWLTVFAVLVRGAMTLYHVPHLALGAELSNDYHERTSIVAWRTVMAVVGGVLISVVSLALFFPETDAYEQGLLNPAGYVPYSIFAGALMVLTIWYSAWGTRSEIPRLPPAPEHPEPFSVRRLVAEFGSAWQNASFRALFLGFTTYGVFFGVLATLQTHINTFFWEFDTVDLRFLAVPAGIGFLVGTPLTIVLHRRFDKLPTLLGACFVSAVVSNILIVARLLDLAPANDSPVLLPLIFVVLTLNSAVGALGFISAGSMMADVAEQHELRSGRSQSGVFFSSTAFSGKLASGLGGAVAGFALDLIAFPLQAAPSEVPAEAIRNLGLLNVSSFALVVVAIAVLRGYRITAAEQGRTRAELDGRAVHPSTGTTPPPSPDSTLQQTAGPLPSGSPAAPDTRAGTGGA